MFLSSSAQSVGTTNPPAPPIRDGVRSEMPLHAHEKVIGLVSNVVSELSEPTKAFREEFKNLQLYLTSHELPDDLCDELRAFVSLKFESKGDHTEARERIKPSSAPVASCRSCCTESILRVRIPPQIVNSFPPVFRARLFRILYKPIIEQAYLV